MTNASRSNTIVPQKQVVDLIEARFGNEVRELFKTEPKALTAEEAGYLAGFRDADALRNRATKARQERKQRLLSKGIRPSEEELIEGSPVKLPPSRPFYPRRTDKRLPQKPARHEKG